jgi:hypothetical protein
MKKFLLFGALILVTIFAVAGYSQPCVPSYPPLIEFGHSYCIKVCAFDLYTINVEGIYNGEEAIPYFVLETGCAEATSSCNVQCTAITDVPLSFVVEFNPIPPPGHFEFHGMSNCFDIRYYHNHDNVWVLEIFALCDGCFCLTFDRQLSAEVTGFDAIASSNDITLHWTTASETNSESWLIDRSESAEGTFTRVHQEQAVGNAPTGATYSWVDRDVHAGIVYYYRLFEKDISGNVTPYGAVTHAELLSGNGTIPTRFALRQNYPNPFNPTTTFEFDIPAAGHASLKVFDLAGREVATVIDGELSAQTYHVTWSGAKLSTGVYFYTLKAGNFTDTKKLVLLK